MAFEFVAAGGGVETGRGRSFLAVGGACTSVEDATDPLNWVKALGQWHDKVGECLRREGGRLDCGLILSVARTI